VATLVGLGVAAGLGWLYWAAVIATAGLLTAEQAVVRPDDLSRVNLAFFTLNGCVSLILGAATIADVMWVSGGG
jgi:4-hydroxybenzoate polyprenyltransferase